MSRVLPQFVLLYVISKLGSASLADVANIVYALKKEGLALGYNFVKLPSVALSKDLQLDLNLLKVLGLVKEEDGGKYSITEKGRIVVAKLCKNPSYRSVIKAVEKVLRYYANPAKVQGQS